MTQDKVKVNGPSQNNEFVLVQDPSILLSILKTRIPHGTSLYNMVLLVQNYKNSGRHKFYTLFGDLTHEAWIIATFQREDFGTDIVMSVPLEPIITQRVKDAFRDSAPFDWNSPHLFISTNQTVSTMIMEIGCYSKGIELAVRPSAAFYFDLEDAKNLQLRIANDPDLELRDINNEQGIRFLSSSYKYETKGTQEFVKHVVSVYPSIGVYIGETLVCGMVTYGNGNIGMLYTAQGHRNKGYAQLCMAHLVKITAQDGRYPYSVAELKNEASIKFHQKMGFKFGNDLEFLHYTGSNF